MFKRLVMSEKKLTLVLGASTKEDRYSYQALLLLQKHQHPVIAVGNREGIVGEASIVRSIPVHEPVDTLTMYLSARNQKGYYKDILKLHPKRVIFNPGAENPDFEKVLNENGISTENACTLVLLSVGNY